MVGNSRFRFQEAPLRVVALGMVVGLFCFLFLQVALIGVLLPTPPPPVVTLHLETPSTPKKQSNHSMGGCPSYGCPTYPRELDEAIDDLNKLRQNKEFHLPQQGTTTRTTAMLTRKSNRRDPPFNQDSMILVDPFQTLWTQNYNSFFLAGIFDGHGNEGHIVSQIVARELPNQLSQKLNALFQTKRELDDQDIIRALKETFIEVDVNLSHSAAMRGGCTASVTLRVGSKLFIANAGDSRTIVVRAADNQRHHDETTSTIVYMTRMDKAHLPDERKRIEDLGGKLHIPSQHPEFSRVVVYSTVAREHVGLAMSRSLGDWEWKPIGVIAEPIVDIIDLTNITNAFLLIASDGLWDMRRPIFFANRFAESFFYQPNGKQFHPWLTCQDVINAASPLEESVYRDDISLLAMRLE